MIKGFGGILGKAQGRKKKGRSPYLFFMKNVWGGGGKKELIARINQSGNSKGKTGRAQRRTGKDRVTGESPSFLKKKSLRKGGQLQI